MNKRKALTDKQGEVRELTADDLAEFRSASEVLAPALRKTLGVRGPQKAPVKERITIRLSPDVLQRFRDSGAGWQARIDSALKDWLKSHRFR